MKRDRFEIIAEILRTAKNGAKKTRIMYQCNLSYHMTKRLLTYLLETGFLRIGDSFHTTEKGLEFLQTFQTLELLMNTRTYPAGQSRIKMDMPEVKLVNNDLHPAIRGF